MLEMEVIVTLRIRISAVIPKITHKKITLWGNQIKSLRVKKSDKNKRRKTLTESVKDIHKLILGKINQSASQTVVWKNQENSLQHVIDCNKVL